MALGEIAEFVGASAGIALAGAALAVTVAVFTAVARMGNKARASADKK